tara:strand:+ start:104 stop:547 length:444 start_codon:yes stop_codon:yes gene_type:complete
MIFKKKFLLLTIFLIIIFQILLFTNNNQKTSFRYFIWTAQELSIGKLISISFFSGLLISTIINSTFTNYKEKSFENSEENDQIPNNNKEIKTNVDIPPQRDIRDAQPTISVNYRVVKNTEESNFKNNQNYSNYSDKRDDWNDDDDDW